MITPKDELFNKEMWEKLNTDYITQTLEDKAQKELKTETKEMWDTHWEEDSNI